MFYIQMFHSVLIQLVADGYSLGSYKIQPWTILFFRDRFRTVCNITGDGIGAAVVERFSRNDFGDDLAPDMEELQDAPASETYISRDGVTCTNFCARETKM
jgi:hypothetical protein